MQWVVFELFCRVVFNNNLLAFIRIMQLCSSIWNLFKKLGAKLVVLVNSRIVGEFYYISSLRNLLHKNIFEKIIQIIMFSLCLSWVYIDHIVLKYHIIFTGAIEPIYDYNKNCNSFGNVITGYASYI